jgi:hypothetical protein
MDGLARRVFRLLVRRPLVRVTDPEAVKQAREVAEEELRKNGDG